MKKIILPAILFASYFMTSTVSEAKNNSSSKIDINKVVKLAHCEIHDKTKDSHFSAKGNCKQVQKAYEAWARVNKVTMKSIFCFEGLSQCIEADPFLPF